MKTTRMVAEKDATCSAILEALADLASAKPKQAIDSFITKACADLPAELRRDIVNRGHANRARQRARLDALY